VWQRDGVMMVVGSLALLSAEVAPQVEEWLERDGLGVDDAG
jgi:hypothetical protein